jgi:hypothetical protein
VTAAQTADARVRTVQSLRPAVARDEAVRALGGGLPGAARRLALGPLRSIADVYVPLDVFRVTVTRGARRETDLLGIDVVTGALDLYRFDRVPDGADVVSLATANALDRTLSEAAAIDRLHLRVARSLFQRTGFFGARPGSVSIDERAAEIHVPYWVGFFGGGGAQDEARIAVMDAVRRRLEGSKARRLVIGALSRPSRSV